VIWTEKLFNEDVAYVGGVSGKLAVALAVDGSGVSLTMGTDGSLPVTRTFTAASVCVYSLCVCVLYCST
jgi:hypothetical protein